MKKYIMLLGFIAQLLTGKAQKIDYSKYPVYNGNDLGLTYSSKAIILSHLGANSRKGRIVII